MFENGRNIIANLKNVDSLPITTIGNSLVKGGINYIEVSLKSDDAYKNIETLANKFSNKIQVGAGDVVSSTEVHHVKKLGGRFIVSTHLSTEVVEITKQLGLVSCPGVNTLEEAHSATKIGADLLKLYPTLDISPSRLIKLKSELRSNVPIYMAGDINPSLLGEYYRYGVDIFGFDSDLFSDGMKAKTIIENTKLVCHNYDNISDSPRYFENIH